MPFLKQAVAAELSTDAYAFVEPPLVFAFVLDGVLLMPLGFTAIYCARGVRTGERWAWVLGLVSSGAVSLLPIILVSVMGVRYFSAKPFLAAAIVITAAGLMMMIPLLRLPRSNADA